MCWRRSSNGLVRTLARTQRPFQRRPNGVDWTLRKFGKRSMRSPERIEAVCLFALVLAGASTAGAQVPVRGG